MNARKWSILSVGVVGLVLVASHSAANGGRHGRHSWNPNPGVVQIDRQAPDGRSYGDLAGAWWTWAFQFPFAQNPIAENGAVDASRGQSGDVWFLAGTFGATAERTCTVPPGKSLFFPLVNNTFWLPEDAPTLEGARAGVNAAIGGTSVLECTIDGVPLTDLFAYRAQSPAGGYVLEDGPLLADFGYAPGDRDPAVADGYWILLEPLSKGQHDIHFRAEIGAGFVVDVTYHITVVGGKGHHGGRDCDD